MIKKIKKVSSNTREKLEKHLMMISDKVFLIEYYLHNQLLMKLRMFGKNALFCYRTSFSISANTITGIATGTSVCLRALPISKPIKIVTSKYLH